jgi:hypothetical protein
MHACRDDAAALAKSKHAKAEYFVHMMINAWKIGAR